MEKTYFDAVTDLRKESEKLIAASTATKPIDKIQAANLRTMGIMYDHAAEYLEGLIPVEEPTGPEKLRA